MSRSSRSSGSYGSYEENHQLVVSHCGQSTLPPRVALAVRSITRQRRDDPAVWLLAARCLRHTRYPSWAYKTYRRAARLAPDDRAVAEEVGLFGAAALPTQYSRSWPMYLVAARADEARRARVDPILLALARRLPAEASGLVAAASVVAMLGGAWIVRRFHPLALDLPPDFDPLPPAVGALAALGLLAFFLVGLWLLLAPVKRFGADLLRVAFGRQLPVVQRLAVVGAGVSMVVAVVVAAFGAQHETFESLGLWAAGCYGLTLTLALFGRSPHPRRS